MVWNIKCMTWKHHMTRIKRYVHRQCQKRRKKNEHAHLTDCYCCCWWWRFFLDAWIGTRLITLTKLESEYKDGEEKTILLFLLLSFLILNSKSPGKEYQKFDMKPPTIYSDLAEKAFILIICSAAYNCFL